MYYNQIKYLYIKNIAVAFLIAPVFFKAQTEMQAKEIKKQSDLTTLKLVHKVLDRQTLPVNKLKKKAEEKNLNFSGEWGGEAYQIVNFDKVTGKPIYYKTSNAGASAGTRTNLLSPSVGNFNLEGKGIIINEWDGGGVLTTHQEFDDRVIQKDTAPVANEHSTHVAGTMIAKGIVPEAKGMAPKATLHAYEWNNDTVEMIKAASEGMILSNHSYGNVGGFNYGVYSGNLGWHWFGDDEDTEFKMYGKYSSLDRDWDIIALNAPYYLPIKAAGNPRGSGPEDGELHYVMKENPTLGTYFWQTSKKIRQKNGGKDGFDCIIAGSTGKNVLVVGAANKLSKPYSAPEDVLDASFSAFGPTDDGRIKPDITGIGVGIYSTLSSGGQDYGTKSGTSMASPNVTGSLSLLQEHYRNLNNQKFMKAATLRALIANTSMEAGDAAGPDYKFGWGLLDAYSAAMAITSKNKLSLIQENTLNNHHEDRIKVKATSQKPIKATIAWADPVPDKLVPSILLNDRTKTLVNDLDIKIIAPDGRVYQSWTLDPDNPSSPAKKGDNSIDNIEQVVVDNPIGGGEYEIVITHKGELKKNNIIKKNQDIDIQLVDAENQDYSLVVTGINNNVENDIALDKISVFYSANSDTNTTPVQFSIINNGHSNVDNAILKYKLINKDSNNTVIFTGEENIAIASGQTLQKTIQFNIEKSFVNYEIVGEVVAQNDDILENNKLSTETFITIADLTKEGSYHSFDFESEFQKKGWTTEDTDKNKLTWEKRDEEEFARTGQSFALNYPNLKKNINDWLFSNPLKVKGNVLYRVVLNVRKFRSYKEEIGVFMGVEPKSSSMISISANKAIAMEGGAYTKYFYEFKPQQDGIIYIGFNHKSDGDNTSYAIGIDDVVFQYAEGKPTVDFRADNTNPTTFDTVSLNNETISAIHQPVNSYEWAFEPNEVEYQSGTTKNTPSPKVIFKKDKTKYDVILKATNNIGQSELIRKEYITTKNVTNVANFDVSNTDVINEGTAINFINKSYGNPMPNSFEWKITPEKGWKFTGGTQSTSPNIQVTFETAGSYTVALTSISANNTDTEIKEGVIKVLGEHEAVKNLKASLLDNKIVHLNWQRPNVKPFYKEGFENVDTSELNIIDGNKDGNTFIVVDTHHNLGKRSLISISSQSRAKDRGTDEYFITPKLSKGAEILKYSVKHQSPERYDVYIVPATGSEKPSTEQITSGNRILSFNGYETPNGFVNKEFNIKAYTTQDFFVAFHHKTNAMDKGYLLALDDIEVGYKNDFTQYTTNSVSTLELSGYDIYRNGHFIKNINNPNILSFKDENITDNGIYTYDVYALYNDSKKSNNERISINVNTLSIDEAHKSDEIKVSPNPSNGKFSFIFPSYFLEKTLVKVYDNAGRLVLENSLFKNNANIDLTGYPKGGYIVELVNNSKTYTRKLLVQ